MKFKIGQCSYDTSDDLLDTIIEVSKDRADNISDDCLVIILKHYDEDIDDARFLMSRSKQPTFTRTLMGWQVSNYKD